MSTTIRITLTKEIEEFLAKMQRGRFRFLENSEIIRFILSEWYNQQVELENKHWQVWARSLPTVELSDEEQESLSQGIEEFEKLKPGEGYMSVEELMSATEPNQCIP